MTYLLAIDPAAERSVSDTGWAFGSFSDTEPFKLIESGAIHGGFEGFVNWLSTSDTCELDAWVLPDSYEQDPEDSYWDVPLDIVVCEKYVPFNSAGDPSPMLIEGVVRYFRPDTVLQASSGKNTLVPDSLLKAYGLWTTEGHHHDSREAIRHALCYMLNTGHRPTLDYIRKLDY